MSWTLRRTRQAREDLLGIWDYVAADSAAAADRLLDELSDRFEKTSDFPELGRAADEIAPGHRVLTCGSYLLIYAVDKEAHVVDLVRVVHGARDWPALFR
jgi:toxin ParE1/3/4